jgi:hypothetical protein
MVAFLSWAMADEKQRFMCSLNFSSATEVFGRETEIPWRGRKKEGVINTRREKGVQKGGDIDASRTT